MFDGVGWGELVVLLLIGLFVFGPDRLPKAARDAARLLRQLRQMATGVRNDIRSELGPELADLDLRTLHPKTFVRKHLLEDDDPLLPSYLTKRGALDRALFDDLGDPPSLRKGIGDLDDREGFGRSTPGASTVSLSKSVPGAAEVPGSKAPVLSKASTVKTGTGKTGTVPTQEERAGQPSTLTTPTTPYDLDAT